MCTPNPGSAHAFYHLQYAPACSYIGIFPEAGCSGNLEGLSLDAFGKPAPPFIGVPMVDVTYSPGCAFCLFSLYSAVFSGLFMCGRSCDH